MPTTDTGSNITSPTKFLNTNGETYAYRRFGSGPGSPLLFLQHFTGTLDNWDPVLTDALVTGREVILFDNAGGGRSSLSRLGTRLRLSVSRRVHAKGPGIPRFRLFCRTLLKKVKAST